MSALTNELPMIEPAKAFHTYYADAYLLTADLEYPIKEKIKPQGLVKLPPDGSYQFKRAEPFHLEGVLSYQGGYTQVAGHPSRKTEGFATLSTSVLEGLNVLDVITADRVVAQISTVHPVYGEGQVPSVTFLGTRFDNLRIAGHKVEVERSLEILGPKPDDDESYFDNRDVLDRISQQYERIAKAKNLPDWAAEQYPKGRPPLNGKGKLECSLINRVADAPGTTFGHVIDLPHFGKIFLGELEVHRTPGDSAKRIYDQYRFHLTMIRLEMGCVGGGTSGYGSLDSNGGGSGGGNKGGPTS
ncbi:MAG TPA: hypothetical protein VFF64_20985 [Candidatus Eremiobacteraceae bacterium]|nr:hypothetical protein [Candidatus Eremiobacteraceae bacterium]